MFVDELTTSTYFDCHSGFSFDYYEPDEVNAAIDELRKKYELAIATIKEYKNDTAVLKDQITVLKHQACKMNCMMVKHYNEVCDDNQHQKYKRCLAMVKRCAAERDIFSLMREFAKVRFYKKWHRRWLEIAEQFKPSN